MQIVIIISIKPVDQKKQIAKWELAPVPRGEPSARAASNDLRIPSQDRSQIPTQMQIVTTTPVIIIEVPLVLEFEKNFHHPTTTTLKTDIIFSAQEPSDFAGTFWGPQSREMEREG